MKVRRRKRVENLMVAGAALLLCAQVHASRANGAAPALVPAPGASFGPQDGADQAGASTVDLPQVERYVRVGADGARLRNLQDASGIVLTRVEAGMVLAVHRESYGWLEVEPPGGFPVWVHGRYLNATAEQGVYEIRGNGINMRPRPSSDVSNFPMPKKLHAGDRVRWIKRADESLPENQDWVQVWSPLGATAWVQATEIQGLPTGKDGRTLWRTAMASGLARTGNSAPGSPSSNGGSSGTTANSSGTAADAAKAREEAVSEAEARRAAAQAVRDEAEKLLREAELLKEHERNKSIPDFFAMREAYRRPLELVSEGEIALAARHGLETIDYLEQSHAIQTTLEKERLLRDQEYLRLQREAERASRLAEADAPRYDVSGVLVRRVDAFGDPSYFLSRNDEDVAEVVCESGRYDLAAFLDHDIGVRGPSFEQTLRVDDTYSVNEMQIDARRITVLSRR